MTIASTSTETPLRICPQCGTETHGLVCKRDGFATVEHARYVAGASADRGGAVLNGRWRLDEPLRADALAVLYRGWDLAQDRAVAIRLLNGDIGSSLDRIARFQREGRFLTALVHPHIVQTYEHGVAEDGTLYVAEELCASETLERALALGPMPAERVVNIGRQLFEALAEAHTHGIQHRSLSLSCLRVVAREGTSGHDPFIKVDGFGWVRILADEQGTFTFPRELGHAFTTMAPEQARGRGVSVHADVYSAGAILYALLCGALPFGEGTPSDLLVAHSVKIPRPPERDGRPLHGPLVDLVMRCLEKKPWNRPDGAGPALDLLEGASGQPFTVQSPTAVAMTPLPIPRLPVNQVESRIERLQLPDTGQSQRVVRTFKTEPIGSVMAPLPGRPPQQVNTQAQAQVQAPGPGQSALTPSSPRAMMAASTVETQALKASATRKVMVATAKKKRALWPLVVTLIVLAVGGGGVALGLALSDRDEPKATSLVVPLPTPVVTAAPAQVDTTKAPSPMVAEPGPSSTPETKPAPAELKPENKPAPPEVKPEEKAAVVEPQPTTIVQTPSNGAPTPAANPLPTWPSGPPPEVKPETPKPETPKPETPKNELPKTPKTDKTDKVEPKKPDAKKPTPDADPFAELDDPSLKPKPETPAPNAVVTRQVLVESEPDGASVLVNGRVVGATPLYVEWDDIGHPVSLKLQRGGYKPAYMSLSGKSGKSVHVVLEAAPPEGP